MRPVSIPAALGGLRRTSFVVGPDTWQEDAPPDARRRSGPGIPGTLLEPHGPHPWRNDAVSAAASSHAPTRYRNNGHKLDTWRARRDGGGVRCAVTQLAWSALGLGLEASRRSVDEKPTGITIGRCFRTRHVIYTNN